jgi:phosphoribosylanthranilate isomerase
VVKVCGLTRLEDARAAHEAGVDWLGFILSGESPRRIDAARARDIVAAVEGALAVAVMVGPSPDEALRLATTMGATRVQLHRVSPARWPSDFPLPAAFSVPMDEEGRLTGELPRDSDLLLLDAAHPVLAGGTGRRVPWGAAAALARTRDIMLAGGLDDLNVGEAIAAVRPFGVDASSGLESRPGIKDADKMRRFVDAARRADAGGR